MSATLVPTLDVHLGFEVAVRHLAHPLRQDVDPAQQHPAHEAVADGEGGEDTEDADRHQEGATGVDGHVGCLVGLLGGLAGECDQAVDLGGQLLGERGCPEQQVVLVLLQRELLDKEIEAVPLGRRQVHQLIEDRGHQRVEGGALEGAEAHRQASRRGLETLLKGFR